MVRHTKIGRPGRLRLSLCACLLAFLAPSMAWAVTIPATPDLSCVYSRIGATTCTANDFTVGAAFSAAPGTPPVCSIGQSFEFQVDMTLTSNSPTRYDVGFFFGENGNDPTNPGGLCSVATFPTSDIPSSPPTSTQPWANYNGNACADFYPGGTTTTRINQIKVMCQSDANGYLTIPYTLVYNNNANGNCSGPVDVVPGTSSKCQGGGSTSVNGGIPVYSGAYVDVTKKTNPTGDSQAFSYTATGPAGSKVMAMVNGVYTPANASDASNTVTVSLTGGQTARFFINATATNQTLTISEAAATNWESTAAISCAPVTGSPALTTDNANRVISAILNATNSAAACTVTNTKKAQVTLQKNIGGRVAANDQFALTVTDVTATTTGSSTGLQGVSASKTVSGGTQVDLSEAISGTGTLLSQYSQAIGCSNTLAGSPTVLPSGSVSGFPISLTPVAGDNITCTITNNARPTITKAFGATNLASGASTSMTVTIGNTNAGAITLTSALTDTFPAGMTIGTAGNSGTCSGITATTGATSFTMANGTAIPAGGCTIIVNVTSSTPGPATNTIAAGALQTGAGSNAAAATAALTVLGQPTVQVSVVSNNGTGTFTLSGTNGVAANFTITTVTAGTPVAGPVYTVTSAGSSVTVTDTPPAGWPANPTSATCSDANGTASGNGSGTFGTLANNILTIPTTNLKAGAQIICTFTNTLPAPTVQLAKTANGSGTFGYTLTNLSSASDSITVTTPTGTASTVASPTTSTVTSLTTQVTAQESTVPSGWPVNPVSAACIDTNGASSGNGSGSFGSLSGNTLSIPASYLRSGAQIVCTFTNTAPGTGLVLVKAVDKTAAYPGDVLTYTITYSNSSLEPLTNVIISDVVPAYTYNPVASCVTPLPSAITGCTAVTTSTGVNWQLSGSLAPNASGQVKLSVTIQQ